MGLRNLKAENFRSFRSVDLEFGCFTVLVGANASGKSSLVELLRFLRDIVTHGLDNAVSMQGGIDYLRNRRVSSREPVQVCFVYDTDDIAVFAPGGDSLEVKQVECEFSLVACRAQPGYVVAKDSVLLRGLNDSGESTEYEVKRTVSTGNYTAYRDGKPLRASDLLGISERRRRARAFRPPGKLLLETTWLPLPVMLLSGGRSGWSSFLEDLAIYDFDPKLSKRAVPVTGRRELEEDGSNLALVLDQVMKTKKDKDRFERLIGNALPFVESVRVQRHVDKSVLLTLKESGSSTSFPAPFLSDGTVNIAALVAVLYFDGRPFTIIEEPERNIHPSLIRKVVTMLREAAQEKQVLVTTHSAEIVKHTPPESLLLVSRGENGDSEIQRPYQNPAVKALLRNEVGIDDLFVSDLLSE